MRIKIDPLDTLFSEFVRRRAIRRVGGCERCLVKKREYKELQCSHFHGRRMKSVRWDVMNAAGLCFLCHQYLGENPLEHVEWFRNFIGEREFDMLSGRVRIMCKPDKKLIKISLQVGIKELIHGR